MIPNISKGKGITGAINYAMGEGNDKETGRRKEKPSDREGRAEILGGQNFGFTIDSSETLDIARRMMEDQAREHNQRSKTQKCENDCLHMSLSWNHGEKPSADEMREAAQGALKALGMEEARAVFIAHRDTDHAHLHIVASRIDYLTGRVFDQTHDFMKAQEWALQWEEERGQISPARQGIHDIRQAVKAHDNDRLLELMTEKNPTFTGFELKKAIRYGGLSPEEVKERQLEIMDAPQLITLRDDSGKDQKKGTDKRYTTAAVIEEEKAVMSSAGRLDGLQGFGLDTATRDKAAAEYTLTGEQRAALEHVTGDGGFAMIRGQAGTGKSQTLKAVREGYEAEGFKVVGLSWTKKVVNGMQHEGFATANTVSSELDLLGGRAQAGLPAPSESWDSKTVLMVDEFAQLSTHATGTLMKRAEEKGAKLIAVGDDKQFSSIERGGMFTLLRRDREQGGFGAAEITEVQRFKNADAKIQADQRAAWQHMHKGDFRPALEIFEAQGCINWSKSQEGSKAALAARYQADMAADPTKERFIFAATNADVRELNEMARQAAKAAGKLGEDRVLAAAAGGPLEITTGDRLQINTNGINKAEKQSGIVKDAVGTVMAIDTNEAGKPVVTLRFDAPKGKEPPEAVFVVGDDRAAGEINQFSRGYAGTSYKGQGRSIDATYLLHSAHWQASGSYVSATRHKETTAIFASQESVTKAEPWMMETGGHAALKGHHLSSAEQSYERWAEEKPRLAAKYNVGSYVTYVQEQWAKENAGKTDLDRLAESMGRDDLKRAAMSFEIDGVSAVRSGLAGAEIFKPREAPTAEPEKATERPQAAPIATMRERPPQEPETSSREAASPRTDDHTPDEPFVDPLANRATAAEGRVEEDGAYAPSPLSLDEWVDTADRGIHVAGEMAGEAGERLVDFVSSLAGAFAGASSPRTYSAAELARDPAARRENYARAAAERRSNEAIDHIRIDLEAGRRLQPADVRNLTQDHLLQIRAHGDDYVRQMVDNHERERERSFGRERERDR